MLATGNGEPISEKSAFTGELTLSGDVLPVGGIRSKVVAAYINGIAQVFIPKLNFYELGSLPGRVKSAVSIHLASNIRQVEAILWPR
jgi:ATP-dependent Lon protease